MRPDRAGDDPPPWPFIVADRSAVARTGRRGAAREFERRLAITQETLRTQGVEPVVTPVRRTADIADTLGPAIAYRFPAILGDDASIRAAVAAVVGRGRGAMLGVLASHAEVDFVRTFGIPPNQPAFAAERLLSAPTYPIDVGKVTHLDRSGAEVTTYFAGLAEIGFGGQVARREARARVRRTAAFSGFWLTQLSFRTPEVRVVGERREFAGRAHDVIIGNTQYGRHGIRLSPRSFPGDGALDLLIMTGAKSQQTRLLPRMFQGEHVPDDSIQEFRARHIRVECERPLPMHADGVYLGTTPATFELIPGALTLRI